MPETNLQTKLLRTKERLSASIIAQLLSGNPLPALNNAYLTGTGTFSPAFIRYLIDYAVKSPAARARARAKAKSKERAMPPAEKKAIDEFIAALATDKHDKIIIEAICAKKPPPTGTGEPEAPV